MRNFFVGALCALGIFLVAYNGYDLADRMITNIADAADGRCRAGRRRIGLQGAQAFPAG
jgi:hypothetical protein